MPKKRKTVARGKAPAQAPAAASKGPDRSPAPGRSASKNTMSRRTVLKSAAFVGVAIAGGAGIHYHDQRQRLLHDLTSIGAGQPVVVQVHDPSCPSCRTLKRTTENVLEQLPEIVYRIADLNSREGQKIAEQYGVGKVTLLLFNADGKHIGTIQGVTPAAELDQALRQQFRLT